MNKILILAYYFPPLHSIGAIRNYNVFSVAKEHFDKTFVFTTSNSIGHRLQIQNNYSDHITTIKTLDYRTASTSKNKRSIHREQNGTRIVAMRGILSKFLDSFPLNIIFGEGGLLYIWSAYQKSKELIKKEDISVIYSSFRPFSDHFIAFLLKRKFDNIYWIADYRDIHVDKHRKTVLFPSFQKKINKWLLSRADVITTVSNGLSDSLKKYGYPVKVLRNGYAKWMQNIGNSFPVYKLTFGYTGSIYHSYQTIGPLLKSLRSLIQSKNLSQSNLQFIYAGKDNNILKTWFGENSISPILDTRGMVSQEESFSIQRSTHINVLLTWSHPGSRGILTGKLYEYILAQKPILCIVQGSFDEELSELFDKHNLGFVFYTEETDMSVLNEWILSLYNQWTNTGQIQWAMNDIQALDFEKNCERFFTDYLN